MINLLSLLPNELIAKISEYADSKTKRNLSMVDRLINALVFDAVRSIGIFPPDRYLCKLSNAPQDVLVGVIDRYPTLKKIVFGPPKNWSGNGEFRAKEVPFLKSLISYLVSDLQKHPLSSVKIIQLREIVQDLFGDFDAEKAKDVNKCSLNAIGHRGLEKVRISVYNIGSNLSGTEIQPVLNNSPNLKTFIFDGFQSAQTIYLSFANQPLLSKVKLLNWKGTASTLESLKNCKKLEELVVEYTAYSLDELKAILIGDHP